MAERAADEIQALFTHPEVGVYRRPDPKTIVLAPVGYALTAERFLVVDPENPPVFQLSYMDSKGQRQYVGKFYATLDQLRETHTQRSQVTPELATGVCLIGDTRPIDW